MASAVAKTIESLQEKGGIRGTDIANLTDVSKSTVSRWSSGQVSPAANTQLVLSNLRYVVDRLTEFYSPEETRLWLYSRNELLGGASAMELIHDGQTDLVLNAIEQLATLSYD